MYTVYTDCAYKYIHACIVMQLDNREVNNIYLFSFTIFYSRNNIRVNVCVNVFIYVQGTTLIHFKVEPILIQKIKLHTTDYISKVIPTLYI